MVTDQNLLEIEGYLNDLRNAPFEPKIKEALRNAAYIIRQANGSLGGGDVPASYLYDILSYNYLKDLLGSELIDPKNL